jgi:hypothetical protein
MNSFIFGNFHCKGVVKQPTTSSLVFLFREPLWGISFSTMNGAISFYPGIKRTTEASPVIKFPGDSSAIDEKGLRAADPNAVTIEARCWLSPRNLDPTRQH